jgi:hypothetical protein
MIIGKPADRMIAALKKWHGQKIEIMIGPGVPEVYVQEEPEMFAGQMGQILKDAGWIGPDGTWLSILCACGSVARICKGLL